MKLCHSLKATSVRFDDPNVVGSAGLVPVSGLAERAGLAGLADQWLTVPGDKGANAGAKVTSLVAGMAVGADSIDDMAVLRHGGMGRLFQGAYAPSTLGSFLRSFTFGHVRQLDAVASRFLQRLRCYSPAAFPVNGWVFCDIDDTLVEVHGYQKQGARFGYTKVRGLDALLATVSGENLPPLIVAQRLRKGSANSQRGAARLVGDALTNIGRVTPAGAPVLLRADSGFTGAGTVHTALRKGADVSVTLRQTGPVRAAIAAIGDDGWIPITYSRPVFDPDTGQVVRDAEVNEIGYTMFSTKGSDATPVTGRLIVRRYPDINAETLKHQSQDGLFQIWRFHAFFTTVSQDRMATVTADKTHRAHAIIEQVHADLKNSALAHMPSGHFAANSAWLVLAAITFNLTRAAAHLAGTGRATTATIRRTLINIPARVAASGHLITIHLPHAWPWETNWNQLYDTLAPPGQNNT